MITINIKEISKSDYEEATGFNMINKDLFYYKLELITGGKTDISYRTSFSTIKNDTEVLKHIRHNTSDFGSTLGILLTEMYDKTDLVKINFL